MYDGISNPAPVTDWTHISPSNDDESDLKLATLREIECDCGYTGDTHTLYYCNHPQCGDKIYCSDCAAFFHRPNAPKYHPFETIEINALVKKAANADKSKFGRDQVITLIGIARYHRISGYIKFTTNTALESANAVPLIQEIRLLLQGTNKLAEAASATSEATKAIANAQEVASTAQQAVKAMESAVDKLNVAYVMESNPSPSIATRASNYLWSSMGYDVGTSATVTQYEKVAEEATKKATTLLKESKKMNTIKNLQLEKATTATKSATDSMKNSIKSGGYVVAILTAAEMSYHALRYSRNEISGRELCRLSGKALCRNLGSLAGSTLGGQIGIAASTHLVGLGACASVTGLGVGLLGGMMLGYYLGKSAEAIWEKYFPPDEEVAKKKLLGEALLYFRLEEEDIKKPAIFNAKSLKKEFKLAALKAHPDRNGGSSAKWYKLSMYYGVLKGLLEQNDTNKEIAKNIMIDQKKTFF
eukprot:526516_1